MCRVGPRMAAPLPLCAMAERAVRGQPISFGMAVGAEFPVWLLPVWRLVALAALEGARHLGRAQSA